MRSVAWAAVICALYAGLSALCLFYPTFVSFIPQRIIALAAAVIGPPAILVWGWEQQAVHAFATAWVAVPVLVTWRTKLRGCGVVLALGAWLFWGFIAWAISI